MNLTLRIGAIALIAGALLSNTSCKKNEDDSPVCRITSMNTIDGSSVSVISIVYDNDGRISTVTTTGSSAGSKVFTYSGNSINITEKTSSGVLENTYAITTNGNQNVTSVITKNNLGVTTETGLFEYDGNGKLSRATFQYGSGTPYVTNTQFVNGDLSLATSTGSVSTYSYYTDKAYADGDIFKIQQLISYGALYIVNAHLVKSITSDSDITNFSYDYDSDGKIIKATSTSGSDLTSNTYSYTCK